MEDERLKNKHYVDSWKNGFKGIWYVLSTQLNAKIQLIVATIVIICAIYFKVSMLEAMFIVFAIMFVIATEIMNTAVEETVNLCTKEFHPIAKIAKDVAAGAVVLSAINAVIIAILIIINHLVK